VIDPYRGRVRDRRVAVMEGAKRGVAHAGDEGAGAGAGSAGRRAIIARSGGVYREEKMAHLTKAVRISLFCVLTSAAGAVPAADTPAPVRVIEPGELTLLSYTVVQRLWTETWHSAFWTTTQDASGAAIAMLTGEAAKLGADAVTHLSCFRDGGAWFSPEGYFCTALAIKLR
jgi:hypothetical protein